MEMLEETMEKSALVMVMKDTPRPACDKSTLNTVIDSRMYVASIADLLIPV